MSASVRLALIGAGNAVRVAWTVTDLDQLRWLYGQFARGNYWAAREVLHPNVEWVMTASLAGLDERGVYRGIEECGRGFRDWLSAWDWVRTEATEFIQADDAIVVICQDRARLKGGSAEVTNDVAAVWTMRDGKAIRVQYYDERGEALAAAGLSP
jgi:ketosteroid isomerase-like protein